MAFTLRGIPKTRGSFQIMLPRLFRGKLAAGTLSVLSAAALPKCMGCDGPDRHKPASQTAFESDAGVPLFDGGFSTSRPDTFRSGAGAGGATGAEARPGATGAENIAGAVGIAGATQIIPTQLVGTAGADGMAGAGGAAGARIVELPPEPTPPADILLQLNAIFEHSPDGRFTTIRTRYATGPIDVPGLNHAERFYFRIFLKPSNVPLEDPEVGADRAEDFTFPACWPYVACIEKTLANGEINGYLLQTLIDQGIPWTDTGLTASKTLLERVTFSDLREDPVSTVPDHVPAAEEAWIGPDCAASNIESYLLYGETAIPQPLRVDVPAALWKERGFANIGGEIVITAPNELPRMPHLLVGDSTMHIEWNREE